MKITGITLHQFSECTNEVSAEKYAGNGVIKQDSQNLPRIRKPACRAGLKVLDSRGPGSRMTAKGRHGPYACWHLYRDVLIDVFEKYPDTVIIAGAGWKVTYRGKTGFGELYPRTARINIGSQLSPCTMPELCDCEPEIIVPGYFSRFAYRGTDDRGTDDLEIERQRIAENRRQVNSYTEERNAAIAQFIRDVNGNTLTPSYQEDSRSAVELAEKQYAKTAKLLGENAEMGYNSVFGPDYHRSADNF